MDKIFFWGILLTVSLTAGCQHLTLQNTPASSSSTQIAQLPAIEPTESTTSSTPLQSETETPTVSSEENSAEIPISPDPVLADTNSGDTRQPSESITSEDITDTSEQAQDSDPLQSEPSLAEAAKPECLNADAIREKTDRALDLCNIAQEMWETGKLEEAILNLDSAYQTILDIDTDSFPEFSQQKEDLRFSISKRILEIYASRQIVVNGQHNEIPIIENHHVKQEIKRLTGPERKFFIQSLQRAGRYRPFIVAELKKAGLPEELSWLPLIESGYKVRALSPARALGLWQFIPSTGYKFGLSRNYYIDERLDPEKSTRAAISYLKELHNLFGDWTTVLAAYNCGEGRVLQKIRRQKINYLDNFWDLYQQLPRETARYVPRFLATLHIVNHLSDYNISVTNPWEPIPYKTCKIEKQIRLKDIAREIDTDVSTLKQLNPELRYALLPPEPYEIRIPEDKTELFLAKLDKIKTTYAPPSRFVYHRVRKGDTLSGLAKKYNTSMRAISSVNRIYKNHTIIAGKVLKIPVRHAGSPIPETQRVTLKPGQKKTYTVKRGDNLWIIARRFNTTTKHIMAVNNLSGTFLHIGQKLVITSHKATVQVAQRGGNGATYRVKSGDSPFSIAKKHNMSLNRLLALNHLTKRSKIFPGQTLVVD